jgi:hypothetical protein
LIIANIGMQHYIMAIMSVFFLILIDSILANINSRIYEDYYKLELLLWNRFIYANLSGIPALLLSLFSGVIVFVTYLFIPISISWVLVYLGFMLYRTINSAAKVAQYIGEWMH